jgi:DNA-binding winged helix-turn-helix (wHTH) protein
MNAAPRTRFRFGELTLSPSQRRLLRGSRELPLIPRYLDLLLLLVRRRQEAVHRQEIFDAVWSDVIVSDSALTQAIRTLRRTLGDDPREPRFIRTVSRHGYQFVFPEVVEEAEPLPPPPSTDRVEGALELLLRPATGSFEDDEARAEAAEALHEAGTEAALARLADRPGHERARAYLREARWEVEGAGPVPLLGTPGGLRALFILFHLRLTRARRLVEKRWLSASAGGAVAGLAAGALGGTALWLGPRSQATGIVPVVLGLLGMIVGGLGAAGVAAGMAVAEALVRSFRVTSLALFGALGGGAVGGAAHLLGQWTVQGLFGRDLSPLGGGFEGFVIGGAAGLGYALATPHTEGGLATPHGGRRLRTAGLTGLAAAVAAAFLAATGSHLGAMSLDFMARSFPGSQVSLDPLAHWLGEETPGPATRIAIGAGEGLLFGFGLAWGLTRRPHHET